MRLVYPKFDDRFLTVEACRMAADILSLVRGRATERQRWDSSDSDILPDVIYDDKWLETASERDIKEVCKAIRYLSYASDLEALDIELRSNSTDAEIVMLLANRDMMVTTAIGPDISIHDD